MTKSVMIVGVGGQGSLLASKLLGTLLVDCGYDVKVSEVHGMSQRGGSVVTYVRYGEQVASPLIEKAGADVVLSFEKLEALRYADYLKPDGVLLYSTQQILPMPVITGAAEYPGDIDERLRSITSNLIAVDAVELAERAGGAKAANVVLLGVLARQLGIEKERWIETIQKVVPAKFLEMNLKAFGYGYQKES
ncbi:indolepyruvate oxidoreductase subunit beta [Feifania hominis]|uniref:Indolepyruvate oxidoreductase subunit beta n=1 Tax=Feifania hominis TaxID=2763660 RepID=A0A926DEQ2_9FIRM|nr:indolepyruvate oxidoreductase subunit beta [Feifania hominis]MBC8535665.1 indolepyruvate oxidoreductase subunit beta [Feifania hominis]